MSSIADPKLFVIFAKVVECGGVTAAAKVLALPKATVSRAVSRLEQDLSARLLERSSRQFRVTEAGSALYQHCERIAGYIEDAQGAVASLQGAVKGRLRVATPFTFSHFLLSPVLGAFLHRYPDIQLDLELTNRNVDPVEEDFDFVIRVGPAEDSGLIARTLSKSSYVLFASKDYIASAPPLDHPHDLVHHQLLGSEFAGKRDAWSFISGKERVDVQVGKTRVHVNDPSVRLDCIVAGLGIGLLPTWLLRLRGQETLVPVLTAWTPAADARLRVFFPDRRSLTPRSKVFLAFLEEQIAPVLL